MWEIFEYSADSFFDKDMQKDIVITEISSVLFNDNNRNKERTIYIDELLVNGEDFIEIYGGYIDIGLNDTMKDLIVNLVGSFMFSILGYFYLTCRCMLVNL